MVEVETPHEPRVRTSPDGSCGTPGDLPILLRTGHGLVERARLAEAEAVFRRCVAQDGASVEAALGLGMTLIRRREFASAAAGLAQVLAGHPDNVDALCLTAECEVAAGELASAQRLIERALEIDATLFLARVQLAKILRLVGRADEAARQLARAYRDHPISLNVAPAARRVILIVSDAGSGNLNHSRLFSRDTNTFVDVAIKYVTPEHLRALPSYDLVFNAMGYPDMTEDGSAQACAQFCADSRRPVLNRPAAVARTARECIPDLLAGIPGLKVPRVWRVAPDEAWPADVAAHLPVIVRPVDTHNGIGARLVRDAAELAELASGRTAPLYVIEFVDYAGADGYYRKFRMIFVDRKPFPYHQAVSPDWLVHYVSADMPPHPWKIAEERRFLEDPAATLGAEGMAAVAAIGRRLDLEYAGLDFSVLQDGRILVFEANPVMYVHAEDEHGALAHKNRHVGAILDAVETMLAERTPAAGFASMLLGAATRALGGAGAAF